ncbi:zinc metalloprotease [Croceivirga lutea]|uniref:RIP metalloprotease RseP n=1 Tax=Croceivirga lutea TaxID=1775167 RepID=UPI00163B4C4B|nr:RIP metalloprotease RseP [Croceivirga lutea]GGG40653.1 zinc metalloprotease [Croceivirga lutea]
MGLFTQIVMFILIISILVILHELGHFLPAKWFKTKVEKFYLFFDVKFSLFKKKIGETEYGIGWLPLGGYVKIAGMIDESMDTEQMKQEPQPWEFRSKPAWQRLIIMLGGVTVNFLLAWIIYTFLLFNNGDTYVPTDRLKDGIGVSEIGEALGLQSGDLILSVDGKKVKRLDDARLDIVLGDEVTVLRNGKEETFALTDEGKKILFENGRSRFLSPRFESVIGYVADSSLAKAIDLNVGDVVTQANGKPIAFFDQFEKEIRAVQNDTLRFTVLRDGKALALQTFKKEGERLGVLPEITEEKIEELEVTDTYSFLSAIPAGFTKSIKVLTDQVRQFKVIFNTKTGAYKQVKGPIGIVEMMPETWNWTFFWSFMAMFSVWLAFINVLPIPALDGGHVMFLLYEMITGRPPSEKILERGQIVGFIILMSLMAIIFGNDIWNIIKRFI